ncbi:MAG: hypothetical protein AAGK02_12395 [Pseudomonadota bacterium]
MNVHWHVGPHKTGTTSIQYLLMKLFGSEAPQPVWYPIGQALGDAAGHGGLAAPFHPSPPSYSPEQGLKKLKSLRQLSNGCQTLILSSENFSFASDYDISSISRTFSKDQLHLIFTVSPLVNRFASSWLSALQFGHFLPMSQSQPIFRHYPGFRPRYFSELFDAANPDQCSVVISDPTQKASCLIQTFFDACSLNLRLEDLSDTDIRKKNKSISHYEAQMLCALNRLVFEEAPPDEEKIYDGLIVGDSSYLALRRALLEFTKKREWENLFESKKINNEGAPLSELKKIAEIQWTDLRKMEDRHGINVLGDLSVAFGEHQFLQ